MECFGCLTHYSGPAVIDFNNMAEIVRCRQRCPIRRLVMAAPIRVCASCNIKYNASKTYFLIWLFGNEFHLPKDLVRFLLDMVQIRCFCPELRCLHFTCFQCDPFIARDESVVLRGIATVYPRGQEKICCRFCWFNHHMCRLCNRAMMSCHVAHTQCRTCATIMCPDCTASDEALPTCVRCAPPPKLKRIKHS